MNTPIEIQNSYLVFGRGHTAQEIRDRLSESKLATRQQFLRRLNSNPNIGFELGQSYREIVYDAVRSYMEGNFADISGVEIGAFGSTRRGELSLHSDTDLIVLSLPNVDDKNVLGVALSLLDFLSDANLKPDIKRFSPKQPYLGMLDRDLVFREIVLSSGAIDSNSLNPPIWSELIRPSLEFDPKEKALYSIFEYKKQRFVPGRQKGVFNIKWDPGGFADFAVIRAIAKAWRVQGQSTSEILAGLEERKFISREEYNVLCLALSDLLIMRDAMHNFAGDTAERLGPKSLRYIASHYPSFGPVDVLQDRIANLRESVHVVYTRLRNQLLKECGLDPNLYENFQKLSEHDQLRYLDETSDSNLWLPLWCSDSGEVIAKCVEINPCWMTFSAAARSQNVMPITLHQIEQQTRDDPAMDFIRVLIAVNNHTSPQTLVELYRHTAGSKVRGIVQHRLTYTQYSDTELTPHTKSNVSVIVFYPKKDHDELLRLPFEQLHTITPGKVYLNFAGRVAEGKNFDAYLEVLSLCLDQGIDFEAHVFGAIEPIVAKQVQAKWGEERYRRLAYRVKYHGRYDMEELAIMVKKMKVEGRPLFLFPKGLTAKELLLMGQPVLSTLQGNMDIEDTGFFTLDQGSLTDQNYLLDISRRVKEFLEDDQSLHKSTLDAKALIEQRYGLNAWGSHFTELFMTVNSDAKDFNIVGTSDLYAHHGPATWSRNLLSYFAQSRELSGHYVFPESPNPFIFQENNDALIGIEDGDRVLDSLQQFVRLIKQLDMNGKTPESVLDDGLMLLLRMAESPNMAKVLCSQSAMLVVDGVFSSEDASTAVHYPLIACDEVNNYGQIINPHLKLTRIIQFVQQGLPQTDINLSCGTLPGLLAACAKKLYGTDFVHVDHVLASDNLLLRGILDSEYYTQAEKDWFSKLNHFIRLLTHNSLNRYVALWPVNQNIAINLFGIDANKIVHIANGVQVV